MDSWSFKSQLNKNLMSFWSEVFDLKLFDSEKFFIFDYFASSKTHESSQSETETSHH